MPKTDKPWERQKGESEKAYEAFAAYRDMGEKLGKSDTLIRRWKVRWNWQERVRAYDNELEREARKKVVADRKAMTERHIGIAMQLQKKALEALSSLSVEDMPQQGEGERSTILAGGHHRCGLPAEKGGWQCLTERPSSTTRITR